MGCLIEGHHCGHRVGRVVGVVVPAGHVMQACCQCPARRTVREVEARDPWPLAWRPWPHPVLKQ